MDQPFHTCNVSFHSCSPTRDLRTYSIMFCRIISVIFIALVTPLSLMLCLCSRSFILHKPISWGRPWHSSASVDVDLSHCSTHLVSFRSKHWVGVTWQQSLLTGLSVKSCLCGIWVNSPWSDLDLCFATKSGCSSLHLPLLHHFSSLSKMAYLSPC